MSVNNSRQSFNYLTQENGAKVVECSSTCKGSSSEHLLQNNRKSLWLSETGFPQYVTFDLSGLAKRPKTFKCFGIDCWHDYQSNPKRMELQVSPNLQNFISWSTIQLEMVAGTQMFDIDPIPVYYNYLKLVVLDSFGDNKCYINQVFLLADNPDRPEDNTGSFIEARSRYSPTGSNRKTHVDDVDEFVVREIGALKEQVEELRGQNKNLQIKVEVLEDSLQQKSHKIANLTDMFGRFSDELKELVVRESNQTKQVLSREIKSRLEELERNMHRRGDLQGSQANQMSATVGNFGALPHRDFSLGSGAKCLNSDSSLRHKQQDLNLMMERLKEFMALREMKLSQLKSMTGGREEND